MTKNELAYKIGSQGLWQLVKKFLGVYFFLFIGLTALLPITLSYKTVELYKTNLFPPFRAKLEQFKSAPGKISNNVYNIQSAKKLMAPLPIMTYVLKSEEIKVKDNKPIFIAVAPAYEAKFLEDIKSKKLNLEYHEGAIEKPLLTYPKYALWAAILNEIESDTISLYKTSLTQWTELEERAIENAGKDADQEDPMDIVPVLLLPVAYFCLYWSQKKRRDIFIKNFKKEDLETAEVCTIKKFKRGLNIFKTTGKVAPLYGTIYEVENMKNIYLIYNGSKSEKATGLLLKYEDHYFFIHEKWATSSKTKKAA